MPEPFHPKFVEAMNRLCAIPEAERPESPEARRWMAAAIPATRPPTTRSCLGGDDALGPEPDGYAADGEPTYSLRTVAAHYGVAEETIRIAFHTIVQSGQGDIVIPSTPLHRSH